VTVAARGGRAVATSGMLGAMRTLLAWAGALAVAIAAAGASAHGPSVKLSWGRVVPETLAIRAGEVVHFQNESATPRTFTVRSETGAFESPPLARGEGWHHEFAEPGRFPFAVAEHPDMRGTVVVAPAE
jgi:plastocyanin